MRIPLEPALSLSSTISAAPSSLPPLYFIDNEPFIIELQGSVELPPSADQSESKAGLIVGKIDLAEPQRPILQIAHHRLEGKLVTLPDPFALLRTTPSSSPDSALPEPDIDDLPQPPSAKKARLTAGPIGASSSPEKPREKEVEKKRQPKVEIIALVRRKIVFSKRPEPIVVLSSEAG